MTDKFLGSQTSQSLCKNNWHMMSREDNMICITLCLVKFGKLIILLSNLGHRVRILWLALFFIKPNYVFLKLPSYIPYINSFKFIQSVSVVLTLYVS